MYTRHAISILHIKCFVAAHNVYFVMQGRTKTMVEAKDRCEPC